MKTSTQSPEGADLRRNGKPHNRHPTPQPGPFHRRLRRRPHRPHHPLEWTAVHVPPRNRGGPTGSVGRRKSSGARIATTTHSSRPGRPRFWRRSGRGPAWRRSFWRCSPRRWLPDGCIRGRRGTTDATFFLEPLVVQNHGYPPRYEQALISISGTLVNTKKCPRSGTPFGPIFLPRRNF